MTMNRVDPEDCLGALDRLDIEIDHHSLLAAAHHDAGQRGVRRGVDLLMRHEGRYENEIARPGFSDVFEMFAPTHPRTARNYIDNAFEFAVMVGVGLRVRLNLHGASPDFLGSCP